MMMMMMMKNSVGAPFFYKSESTFHIDIARCICYSVIQFLTTSCLGSACYVDYWENSTQCFIALSGVAPKNKPFGSVTKPEY